LDGSPCPVPPHPFPLPHANARAQLAFTGSPSAIDLDVAFDALSGFQLFDFGVWVVVYIFFIILSLIQLLNLLIAMLSFTFETVRDESTLQCRTRFAQCLMRLELDAEELGMPVRVGEKKGPDLYVCEFRSVVGKWEGANDPFEETHEDETASVALARITEKLSKLEEKMDRIEQKVDHQSAGSAEAKQGGEVVTELDEI